MLRSMLRGKNPCPPLYVVIEVQNIRILGGKKYLMHTKAEFVLIKNTVKHNYNIVKYYYDLKDLFSISIYFQM